MHLKSLIIIAAFAFLARPMAAQTVHVPAPIPHGGAAAIHIDAQRNVQNSAITAKIVPFLGSTSIYVQKKNWKAGGDSSQVWVSDSTTGAMRVYLTSTETRNTLTGNKYYLEVWMTDSVANTYRIASGFIPMSFSTIAATASSGSTDTTYLHYMVETNAANVSVLFTRMDTVGATARGAIEADVASLDAEMDTVGRAADATHDAAIALKQDLLSAAQLLRLDSILAAGVRITFTSEGSIIKIGVDTTGWNLGARITNIENDIVTLVTAVGDTISYRSRVTNLESDMALKLSISAFTDTLNIKFPRVLSTPGALGYVLKVGPEGTVIWAQDSAGGAGGAISIADSLGEATYGAKFGDDVTAPSFTAPLRVIDTTGRTIDTLGIQFIEHREAAGVGTIKSGHVIYEVEVSSTTMGWGRVFDCRIVADTANGVVILGADVYSRVSTVSPIAGNTFGRYCWQHYIIGQNAAVQYETTLNDAGGYSTGTSYFIKPIAIDIGSVGNLPIQISDEATNPCWGKMQFRIDYALPSGNASAEPIRILEN